MIELTAPLDKNKYIIVLDHQPTDFDAQAQAKVDLVLCGHTHGLHPAAGNPLTYGYKKQNQTNFIITSGLTDKLKSRKVKSEFVIINLKNFVRN